MSYMSPNGWVLDEQGLLDAMDTSLAANNITNEAQLDAAIATAFNNSPGLSAAARAILIAFFRRFVKKLT